MAVRLQMKLGVVAEQDRLPDSPDTVVVVEPSVGSVARSKGHLYLLVTSRSSGPRAREATRLAAETIRNEYYFDESAGIRVCLKKAIGLANKRLAHQRERLGLGAEPLGAIGVAVAVVRGNELFVATLGPAEAYLVRQARLATLPDPLKEHGLPAAQVDPDIWRGEMSVGDSLALVSPNLVDRLGLEELKDALVTLHPQSAVEHLHHRFVAAAGTGSDGAIAFEATEVSSIQRPRTFVPVRPAGSAPAPPEPASIPIADPGPGGVAAMQAGARQARTLAGSALERAVVRLQDLLPRRGPGHRRVRPVNRRRETQRRAAVALLAFVVVASGLGLAIFFAPREQAPGQAPGAASGRAAAASANAGRRALDAARASLARVSGPGVDLVTTDRARALQLLTEAQAHLDEAERAGLPSSETAPERAQVVAALDRLFPIVTVEDRVVFAFDEAADPPFDLVAMVRGPDGVPYVLDGTSRTIWRVNLREKRAAQVMGPGTEADGGTVGEPRLMTVGGRDLLVLDADNTLWRWRPGEVEGEGTTSLVEIDDADAWGDIAAMGTAVVDAERRLYTLYVLDATEQQIIAYEADPDGGIAQDGESWLTAPRPLERVTGLYVDTDVWLADNGRVVRFADGTEHGWAPAPPGDEVVRRAPAYRLLTSPAPASDAPVYLLDEANLRLIAFDKEEGQLQEQYRLPAGNENWSDLRGMYVALGRDGAPSTLVWNTAGEIHFSRLRPVGGAASPAPGGSGPPASPAASAGAGSSAAP